MAQRAGRPGSHWPCGSHSETRKSMIDEKQKKQLETLTVEMVLAFRSAYLANVGGRPPLGYWEQIQNRVRSAAMQTESASEWASTVQRRLNLGSLPSYASRALVELVRFCDEHDAHDEFLALVERDHALVVAMAQLIVEERKRAGKAEEHGTDAV